MKNLQSALLLILTAAVGVLFYLHFSGKKGAANDVTKKITTGDSNAVKPQDLRVAYIDLDSLQKYYEYFKLKNDEIDRERQRIENEIQGGLNKLEKDRVDFLKKGQSITQIDAEKFQQEYQNRYQQLQGRQQTLQNQHLERQNTAIEDIQKRIDAYLKEFNQTAKYSFIFSTGANNPTLYLKDSAFNITPQIIKGLNEAYQQSKKK
jgi:outer membrane protein